MKNLANKLLLLFFVTPSIGWAQVNLVPNFSFEVHDSCPTYGDQIQYASGWSKYSLGFTTPDYYNSCATDSGFGVPNSALTYQSDHRNCSAYAGLITWDAAFPNVGREQIGIQLSQSLVIGEKYFLSFYVVAGGEKALSGWYYGIFSNNVGMRLSTVSFNESNPCPIDNFTHLNYTSILTDSTNWTRVSGSIIADSAYQYLILGNFYDDANTDTMSYNFGPNCVSQYSYYLIDDICISTDSLLCNGGIDVLPCIVGLGPIDIDEDMKIFPNPSSDQINLKFGYNSIGKIVIYDVLGQEVYSDVVIQETEMIIEIGFLPDGVYFLKANSKNVNKYSIKKIIKN